MYIFYLGVRSPYLFCSGCNTCIASWRSNYTLKCSYNKSQRDALISQIYLWNRTIHLSDGGTRWRSWLRRCATSRKVAGSIPHGVTGILHWQSFRPHYGPGVDSPSNRNEYQEYFLVGKGGRYVGLTTLPLSGANCLEIWDPEPPGTLRACSGL